MCDPHKTHSSRASTEMNGSMRGQSMHKQRRDNNEGRREQDGQAGKSVTFDMSGCGGAAKPKPRRDDDGEVARGAALDSGGSREE